MTALFCAQFNSRLPTSSERTDVQKVNTPIDLLFFFLSDTFVGLYIYIYIYIYIYRHQKVDHSSLMLVHSELPLTVILVIYIYVTISVSSWRDFYAESCQKELSEIILIKTVDIELNYCIREKKKYKRIGFQVVASSFTCLGGSLKCHPMKITCWIDWHLSEGKRNL